MDHDLFSHISQQRRNGACVQKIAVEIARPIPKGEVSNLRASLKKIWTEKSKKNNTIKIGSCKGKIGVKEGVPEIFFFIYFLTGRTYMDRLG